MIRSLAIALAALAAAPAAAAADAPVTSVSVTVEIGSTVTDVDFAAEPACAPELTMRLAQHPLRWRRGVPVLATGRSYRFAGRLTCAPEGTLVDAGEAGTFTVGRNGRIAARVAYRGGRTIAFSADGVAVRIAVRAAS